MRLWHAALVSLLREVTDVDVDDRAAALFACLLILLFLLILLLELRCAAAVEVSGVHLKSFDLITSLEVSLLTTPDVEVCEGKRYSLIVCR